MDIIGGVHYANGRFHIDIECEELDLGNKFSTKNVKDMGGLFCRCKSLKKLDLGSKFSTKNVEDISWMFYECKSLKSLRAMNKLPINFIEEINEIDDDIHSAQILIYKAFSRCYSLVDLIFTPNNINFKNVAKYDSRKYTPNPLILLI